jgi:hypothetical protein
LKMNSTWTRRLTNGGGDPAGSITGTRRGIQANCWDVVFGGDEIRILFTVATAILINTTTSTTTITATTIAIPATEPDKIKSSNFLI